jgi:ABC-type transporter Mla subunit MlaD
VSGGQVAALIAAVFFAVGMVAAVYVLVRLAGLISAARRLLTDYHGQASALIERANSAVDRANAQLGRTDAITSSMDEVTANMAELSGHVSALSGLARGIAAGFGTPLLRVSALAFGVRRALALRTTTQRKTLRGASGARPPGTALRGASGGRPPGNALARPPASRREQQ